MLRSYIITCLCPNLVSFPFYAIPLNFLLLVILRGVPFIGSDVTINHCAWVKVDGKMIKSKSCYIISGCDGLHPRFAKVLELLVVADFIVLEVLNCNVHYFDNHFHAYVIQHSVDKSYINFADLTYKSILQAHKKNGSVLKSLLPCSVKSYLFLE